MAEIMTVSEYARATTQLRQMQTQLVQQELNLVKTEIAKLKTAAGKLEAKRKANQKAQRYITTARQAELEAGLKQLADSTVETFEQGRQRLYEATAEVARHDSNKPRTQAITVDNLQHGLRAYRRGDCRCSEICKPAHAKDQLERRHRREALKATQPTHDHENAQPKDETTQEPHVASEEARPASSGAGQEALESSRTSNHPRKGVRALRTAPRASSRYRAKASRSA